MTRHHLGTTFALGDVVPATTTDIIIALIVILAVMIWGVIYERRRQMSITKEQRDTLRHMLGLSHQSTAYRNYFAAPRDTARMADMEAAGLVYWVECSWVGDGGLWYAYRHAAEAVVEDGESLGTQSYREAPQAPTTPQYAACWDGYAVLGTTRDEAIDHLLDELYHTADIAADDERSPQLYQVTVRPAIPRRWAEVRDNPEWGEQEEAPDYDDDEALVYEPGAILERVEVRLIYNTDTEEWEADR